MGDLLIERTAIITFHHECYSRDALVPPGIAKATGTEGTSG